MYTHEALNIWCTSHYINISMIVKIFLPFNFNYRSLCMCMHPCLCCLDVSFRTGAPVWTGNAPVDLLTKGRLTTLDGSLCPGRYFTFSWSVLMISVSFRSFTISSNTHMLTVLSNLALRAALLPTILAMAEPLYGEQMNKYQLENIQSRSNERKGMRV